MYCLCKQVKRESVFSRSRQIIATVCLPLCLVGSGARAHPHVPTDGVYRVMPNDTLWHLAGRFLNDPYRWPEIYAANGHIRNPDLIYPDNPVYLPFLAERATAEGTQKLLHKPVEQQNNGIFEQPTAVFSEQEEPQVTAQPKSTVIAPVEQTVTTDVLASGYVDNLIDPSTPEDDFLRYQINQQTGNTWQSIDHSFEFLSLYRDNNNFFDSSVDNGLHYIARLNTRNWGQLRTNVILLDDNNDISRATNGVNRVDNSGSGLARFSVEQYNLPITENIWLDNIIGTHRQVRYNPFRERPNLINYRFGAAEPDVLGASTQIKFGQSGIGLSFGKLGDTRGSLLPGFRKTEGHVMRGQFVHVLDRQAFSGELWRTQDQTAIDNRAGFRFAYDRLLGNNTVVSLSTVASGSNYAVLAGGAKHSDTGRHDFGAYFFDPDILWIDTPIGDDNTGVFYRYNTQRGSRTLGASLELRRDGVRESSLNKSNSGYLSLSSGRRLSRRRSITGVYNFRFQDFQSSNRPAIKEHGLRSYLTHSHNNSSRSSVGVIARQRSDYSELQLTYGYSKDFDNDSTIEFASTARHTFESGPGTKEYRINGNWNHQLTNGGSVGLGLGYNFGSTEQNDNSGINGYLNFDYPLSTSLGVSLQLDYSFNQVDFEDQDLAGNFFTNDEFLDNNFDQTRDFSALFRLSYQLGGRQGPSVLQDRTRRGGAGGIRGYVYIDSNRDGVRQANETGVPGITVFLNSVHPVVTDSRGEYRFASVGLGNHFLFVDETTLPLPWVLSAGEYAPVAVELRRTATVDIAVLPISLAENE